MKQRLGFTFTFLLLIATVVMAQQPARSPQEPQPGQLPPPAQPRPAQEPRPARPAQPGGPPAFPQPPRPPDPLADVMFPPDFILGHAKQLALTDEQKSYMRGEVQRTMSTFTELQWKLQDETEVLHETLKATAVDEQKALTQLNKVLDIEREIKRLHIGLGVRLKNRLTPEQQEKLQDIRRGPRARPVGPTPPPE